MKRRIVISMRFIAFLMLFNMASLQAEANILGLNVGGWIEQSYTLNTGNPSDGLNAGRVFDDSANDYQFNQALGYLEKTLSDGTGLSIGGRVELLYGTDGRFLHQNGLADGSDDELQLDPVQFYGVLRAPVGNGLTIKAGKYVTMLGAEVINGPDNSLFSRSFLFGYAIPFTHTGVQLDYPVNDNLSVYYGLVKGWDVWEDTNNSLTNMVGLYGSLLGGKLSHIVNLISGPESDNDNDIRTVFDMVMGYTINEKLTYGLNVDYGVEQNAAPDGGSTKWWGLANYFDYTISPQLNSTLRAEFFRDEDGTRLGFASDVYELTLGLDTAPFKEYTNLRLRSEFRVDYASDGEPFDGSNRQTTIALDLIYAF